MMAPHKRDQAQYRQTEQNEMNSSTHSGIDNTSAPILRQISDANFVLASALYCLHGHQLGKSHAGRGCPAPRRRHERVRSRSLPAFMNEIRRLGDTVAGDATRKRKLPERLLHLPLNENLRCPCPEIRCNLMTETIGIHCRRPSAPRGHVASHTCRDRTVCTVPSG